MSNCLRAGCTNAATCAPKLIVPLVGLQTDKDQPYVLFLPSLLLCDVHIAQVKLEHFPNLKTLAATMIKSAAVDWGHAHFQGVAIGSEEFKALDASSGDTAASGGLILTRAVNDAGEEVQAEILPNGHDIERPEVWGNSND